MSKDVRLSIDVAEDVRTELKVYTSLHPGTSIQSIATNTLLRFLASEAKRTDTKYSLVANRTLLAVADKSYE